MKFTEKELEKIRKERMEEIDSWLENEYGVSYTRLEELHDFVVEQDLKHQEQKDKEIDKLTAESTEWESKFYDLQNRIDKAIKYNEHLIRDAKYHLNLGHLKKMKKILQGSDEE